VIYIERLPDTVQKDHVDWGFRIAPIYGENYRYTTAYGLWSYQLLNHNSTNGYDMPMAYGEVFIPQIAEDLLVRFGSLARYGAEGSRRLGFPLRADLW
jgi:hypothetical protein